MSKILFVEDEQDLACQVQDWLVTEGYLVETVDDGLQALDCLLAHEYDLIILDWLLPNLEGVEVCRRFRGRGGQTPVLILTAKSSIDDRAEGLDSGADDYLSKPFHLKELSARVRALLRRAASSRSTILKVGNLVLDPVSHRISRDGEEIHLEPREFNLLEFLMRNANKTFDAPALVERVWESDAVTSLNTVRAYIKLLRQKINVEGKPSLITTVHGKGYRFEDRHV